MIRQRKYLFLGGPWDGQWHPVGYSDGTYRVRERSIIGPGRAATYRRTPLSLPGWSVVIVVFVAEGRRVSEVGDVLPGSVVGEPIDAWTKYPDRRHVLAFQHFAAEAARDLHDAIRERRYRP